MKQPPYDDEFWEIIDNYRKASAKLLEYMESSDLDFSENYPFDKGFGEMFYDVIDWTHTLWKNRLKAISKRKMIE